MKKQIIESMKQDIKDLEGLLNHSEYWLVSDLLIVQAQAIVLNIQDNLEQLVKL